VDRVRDQLEHPFGLELLQAQALPREQLQGLQVE